jgi:hypothetical protein
MGEPSLFWVGGVQPRVMLDGVTAFGGEAGGVAVVVIEPLPCEFALAVSATTVGVVELALVLPVAAAPAAPSSPQPASAIARVPIKEAITTRPAPIPRSACLIPTPNSNSRAGQARDEVTGQGARVCSCGYSLRDSRGGAIRPGNPAVIGFVPLDRKFCAPAFRQVCPWQRQGPVGPDLRDEQCSSRASFANRLILLKLSAWPQAQGGEYGKTFVGFPRRQLEHGVSPML